MSKTLMISGYAFVVFATISGVLLLAGSLLLSLEAFWRIIFVVNGSMALLMARNIWSDIRRQ